MYHVIFHYVSGVAYKQQAKYLYFLFTIALEAFIGDLARQLNQTGAVDAIFKVIPIYVNKPLLTLQGLEVFLNKTIEPESLNSTVS